MAAGTNDIGKHHGWTAEYVVFQFHARIQGDVILNLYVIADAHSGGNVDVLTKIASAPNLAIRHDVRKMPDLRAFADFARLIHDGGGVNVIFGRSLSKRSNGLAVRTNGFAGQMKNLYHPKAIFSISIRSFPFADAFNEVKAFGLQRFFLW